MYYLGHCGRRMYSYFLPISYNELWVWRKYASCLHVSIKQYRVRQQNLYILASVTLGTVAFSFVTVWGPDCSLLWLLDKIFMHLHIIKWIIDVRLLGLTVRDTLKNGSRLYFSWPRWPFHYYQSYVFIWTCWLDCGKDLLQHMDQDQCEIRIMLAKAKKTKSESLEWLSLSSLSLPSVGFPYR